MQVLQVLHADGGLAPVAIDLLQARFFVRSLLLATRALGLHASLFLADDGEGAKFLRCATMACAREEEERSR